jgi:hypothetical protein
MMKSHRRSPSFSVTGALLATTLLSILFFTTAIPLVSCFVSGTDINNNKMMRNRRSSTIPGSPPPSGSAFGIASSTSKKFSSPSRHHRRPLVPVVAAGALPTPADVVIFDNGPYWRLAHHFECQRARLCHFTAISWLAFTCRFTRNGRLCPWRSTGTIESSDDVDGSSISCSHDAHPMVVGRRDCLECSIGGIFILPPRFIFHSS